MPGDPELEQRAAQFAADLLAAVRTGGDITAMTADLDALGGKAVAAVTRAAAAGGSSTPAGDRADTAAITDALATLRGLTESLTPTGDLSDSVVADRYFDRYRAGEPTLAAVLDALRLGREHLDRDDARLTDTEGTVRSAVTALTRYAELAAGIDRGLADAAPLAGAAEQTRQDLLYSVRQRRQDLLTQVAVAGQLVAALAITHRNTVELAAAVRRAVDCTVAALGAAVAAADAIASRRLVLDRIAAVDAATSAAVRATAAVRAGAGTSLDLADDGTASTTALTAAFADLRAALDGVDRLERSVPPAGATSHPLPTSGGTR